MNRNAKKGRLDSGPSQEVSAASGSTTTSLPQQQPARVPGGWPTLPPISSWPEYGTPAYYNADPFSREKRFSVFVAAEQWRLQGVALDELDDVEWYVHVFGDARRLAAQILAATNRIRGFQEIREARLVKREPHVLKATPGWPPIRIPGGGGRYLTYSDERGMAA
jgi:nucleoid-associated protein YgaU